MRDLKFEYLFKVLHTDKLLKRVFTIDELENYEMEIFLLETGNKIVARRQFTGLDDKNDKEIYEGDIVLYEYDHYSVYFDEDEGHYVMESDAYEDNDTTKLILDRMKAGDCKVIENIYEEEN